MKYAAPSQAVDGILPRISMYGHTGNPYQNLEINSLDSHRKSNYSDIKGEQVHVHVVNYILHVLRCPRQTLTYPNLRSNCTYVASNDSLDLARPNLLKSPIHVHVVLIYAHPQLHVHVPMSSSAATCFGGPPYTKTILKIHWRSSSGIVQSLVSGGAQIQTSQTVTRQNPCIDPLICFIILT